MFDDLEEQAARMQRLRDLLDAHFTPEEQETTSRKLDLTFEEWTAWQTAQAAAHASGKLSLEGAQFIYQALGASGPEHYNRQDLVTKTVVTKMMEAILK